MNRKHKWKFNIIDVIFVLVILIGIIFIVLRMAGAKTPIADEKIDKIGTYFVTFTSPELADYVSRRIELGDKLTSDDGSIDLGTVTNIQLEDSVVYNADDSGQLVASSKPGYHTLYLTGKVKASDNGYGITVDGTKFGVGHSMVVRAGDAKMYLVVYDIRKKSSSENVDAS